MAEKIRRVGLRYLVLVATVSAMAQPYKGPRIQLKVRVTPEVHARLCALVAEGITSSVSQAAADLLAFSTDLADQAREIHEAPQPGLWDQEVTWTPKSA
jgi:hypothetical protein